MIAIVLLSATGVADTQDYLKCYMVEGRLVCEYTRRPPESTKPSIDLPSVGGDLITTPAPAEGRDDFVWSGILNAAWMLIRARAGLPPC